MTRKKDGQITRTCLNTARIVFEVILSLQKLQKIEDMEILHGTYDEDITPMLKEAIEYEESEFEEFMENEETILEEFIVDEKSLEYFIGLLKYREVKRSMNWTEFHSAPILNLELSMQRPIIKRRVMHKYLSLTLNFNLPIEELQEQLKVYKEVYDNYTDENKKIDDIYIKSIKDHLFSSLQIFTLPSCHRNKHLLTAGEIGCTDTFLSPLKGRAAEKI